VGGGAGGVGLDHELDGVPQTADLDLDVEGEAAGEPVGIELHEQAGGDLGQPQLLP
jgi:hypothetical protein